MRQEMKEFEESLENKPTKQAIKDYYAKYWKKITGAAVMLSALILLYTAPIRTHTRVGALVMLMALIYLYGRWKDGDN